jgi:type IV secretory pathway TraG/TraD family ATPase VirD4
LFCGTYAGSLKAPKTETTGTGDNIVKIPSTVNNPITVKPQQTVKNIEFGDCIKGLFIDDGKFGVGDMFANLPNLDLGITAKGFFLIFFPLLIVIMLIQTTNQRNKDSRVGHEHGKERIAKDFDYKSFYKNFTSVDGDNLLLSQKVALDMDNKRTNRTTNTLVIGGTGTGKTFRYIKPNIAQFNCSRVITDPSGDIFHEIAPALVALGKNVYLFNIKDFHLSNHYNPLLNVYDAKGNIDPQKVDILVDLYMENASEGKEQGSSDPFWNKSEKAFLTGVIYYVLENDEIPIEDKCFGTRPECRKG